MQDTLVAYYPFVFTDAIDPTNIATVGQQVVSEHIFAFSARKSLEDGFTSHAANVEIEASKNQFVVSLSHSLSSPDGAIVDLGQLCKSITASVSGTTHAPYKGLLDSIDCSSDSVTVKYKSVPANLRYIFTLPDFAIYRADSIPLTNSNRLTATGPYFPTWFSSDVIHLKRNPGYPKDLVANNIDNAELRAYSSGDSQLLIQNLDFEKVSAAYFFGHSLEEKDLEILKSNQFDIDISPNEWLVYFKASPSLPQETRTAFGHLARILQDELKLDTLGAPTDSMIFTESQKLEKIEDFDLTSLNGQTIYTLDSWNSNVVFKRIISSIKSKLPNVQIRTIKREQFGELFSSGCPLSIGLVGLSPVDKLSHLSFLASTVEGFTNAISSNDIQEAAIIGDENEFENVLKKMDARLKTSNFLFPVMSFPGVTAISRKFKVDRKLSFDWGVQLWSIQER